MNTHLEIPKTEEEEEEERLFNHPIAKSFMHRKA